MTEWVEVALEEYKALRGEILTTLQTQYTTLSLGIAAVGVLVGLGFNAWKEPFVAHVTFLGAVPAVAYLVLIIWMGELTRMMRAGDYLKDLEGRINAEMEQGGSRGEALGWETFLRKEREAGKTAHRRWNYRAIIVMYQLLAFAAVVIGLHRLGVGASVKTVLVIVGEAIAFGLVASFLYWQWCARVRGSGRVFGVFSRCCERVGVPLPPRTNDATRAEST